MILYLINSFKHKKSQKQVNEYMHILVLICYIELPAFSYKK